MQISSNLYTLNNRQSSYTQNNKANFTIRQQNCDSVSFQGPNARSIVYNLIDSCKSLKIQDKIKKLKDNPKRLEAKQIKIKAKQDLLELIKSDILNDSFKQKPNLKNLADRLGLKDDFRTFFHFMSPSENDQGKLFYTKRIILPILDELNITKEKTPELFEYFTNPIKQDNELILTINELLDCKINYSDISEKLKLRNQSRREAKDNILKSMLNGTKEWKGIKEQINKNLEYIYSDLIEGLSIPKENQDAFRHFLSLSEHKAGKLSYTEELVRPILEELGLKDESFSRYFNASTKSE